MSADRNEVSGIVVDVAVGIHMRLGPGLLEAAYVAVLAYELTKRGLTVAREVEIPLVWDGMILEVGYRADLIVNDAVIVEVKSTTAIAPVHLKQLLTYLRLADKKLGLLLNFGAELMKNGIHRVANGLEE